MEIRRHEQAREGERVEQVVDVVFQRAAAPSDRLALSVAQPLGECRLNLVVIMGRERSEWLLVFFAFFVVAGSLPFAGCGCARAGGGGGGVVEMHCAGGVHGGLKEDGCDEDAAVRISTRFVDL